MAESTDSNKTPVKDLTAWYQDLSYLPLEYKDSNLWMAQMLFFMKRNSQVLQSEKKAIIYRRTDILSLPADEYKALIDPPTPKDKRGDKKAQWFSADFKAFPIDVHLDNILNATIRTIPTRLQCSLADPVAKLQEQKDKEKIIAQRMVRNIINDFAKELGMPPLNESVDPYKWIQNFTSKKGDPKVDVVGSAIDQIKNKIKDDDGLRMFQQYLYKNGLELAFEIGIKYYFLDLNEFQAKYSDDFFQDIKHFNKFSGRWVIDETSGQPMIRYIDPTHLWTSPFKDKNGDDIIYWFYEENVSMAEFERIVGTTMLDKNKKEALDLQKKQGWNVGSSDVNGNGSANTNNSQMRVGFMSVLSQEANAYSEKYLNNTTSAYNTKTLTWGQKSEEETAKVFNVWYSAYYLPLNILEYNNNTPTNWQEQGKYIYCIKKDIDMMRHGVDKRYAKSSLVTWKDDKRASWTDIKEAFMPKIHTLWHKFQNCVVQDVQGLVIDEQLLGGMLMAVDEANKDGQKGGTAIVNNWKMLRQAGMAWVKFRDKNGNMVVEDPSRLFVPVDSGHMKKGEMYLLAAMNLYNLLTQALAKGQATEGLQPEARTPLGGIEIAKEASSKATYFVEEIYIEGLIVQYAYRAAHFIHTIAKERKEYNYDKRWKQFTDVIGSYNAAEIESIADIQFENIGLTIANKDDSAKRELIVRDVLAKRGQNAISAAMLGLILFTENAKLQIVELSLEEQKQQERAQAEAAQQQQYVMEQKRMDLQIAQALTAAKGQAKDQNIQVQGEIDARLSAIENNLKASTMEKQKQQLLDNKLTENAQKAELDKDKKTHEMNLDQQKSLVA